MTAGFFRGLLVSRLIELIAGGWHPTPPQRYEEDARHIQFKETCNIAVYSIAAHPPVAACFVLFFWTTPARSYVLTLFPLVSLLSIAAVFGIKLGARWLRSPASVKVGHFGATCLASLIGLAWGSMPLALFAGADSDHRMIVVGTTIGVIADVYVLGPILPVCLGFAIPVIVGGFIGLARSGEPSAIALAMLLLIYALFVVFSVKQLNRLSLQRIVDRVRVCEQNDTIALLLRDFEENTSDWLWEIDGAALLNHVSDRLAEAADVPPDDLKNAAFRTLFIGRNGRATISASAEAVLAAIAARAPFRDRIVEIETEGGAIWWKLTGKPIADKDGAFAGYRGVGSDVTESRQADAQIEFMAGHDPLTGLANRAVFMAAASTACRDALETGCTHALLYLDLDGFKGVNDSLGHAAGDEVLQEVVARLTAIAPKQALVSRLGGDEFALLYKPADLAASEILARSVVEALGLTFFVSDSRIDIGVSIGIAYAPIDSSTPDGLLWKADLALYQAKVKGRGRYCVFQEDYETSRAERVAFEADVRLALARREFELHYQPVAHLASGRVVSFEALIRWHSQNRGNVPPGVFIGVAESIGLIVPIGRWVLLQACKAATLWPENIRIAVNISPQHFRTAEFIGDVLLALELSRLDPRRLEIEITESVLLDESAQALSNLHALRQRGIGIALDDFGTGYSSLSYLVNFPVQRIKIDRSFLADFTSSARKRAIVDAVLNLASDLEIEVTAEGVETREQVAALKLRKCSHVQGFLLSRPRPESAVLEMISAAADALYDGVPNDNLRVLEDFRRRPA